MYESKYFHEKRQREMSRQFGYYNGRGLMQAKRLQFKEKLMYWKETQMVEERNRL